MNIENKTNEYQIRNWQPADGQAIFDNLEKPNWAPWLAASAETLAGRARVFSDGHLMVVSGEEIPLASLSMNQIKWDGNINSLPCWDEVAGEPTTYQNTYVPSGNTLVMMSMNVHPDFQGEGFARKLIDQAKIVARDLGVEYLLGSFRPNEYGKYKLNQPGQTLSFESYCNLTREDGWPIDAWIRNLSRNGMQPLIVDHKAMRVIASLAEFSSWKNSQWVEVAPGVWECGEVGSWKLTKISATYQESNLWGLVWKKTGLP